VKCVPLAESLGMRDCAVIESQVSRKVTRLVFKPRRSHRVMVCERLEFDLIRGRLTTVTTDLGLPRNLQLHDIILLSSSVMLRGERNERPETSRMNWARFHIIGSLTPMNNDEQSLN
jgi:hypothetical protein